MHYTASTLHIHNVSVWLLFGQVHFFRENYVSTLAQYISEYVIYTNRCDNVVRTFVKNSKYFFRMINKQSEIIFEHHIYAISNVSTFSRITKYAIYWLPIILINGEMHEVCKIVLWYILHTRCIHMCILNSKRQNKNKTNKQKGKRKYFPPAGFEPGIPRSHSRAASIGLRSHVLKYTSAYIWLSFTLPFLRTFQRSISSP